MTRRSMLAASAGALAGGVLGRGSALAAEHRDEPAGDARPVLFWHSLGRLRAGAGGEQVELAQNADLVGVSFRGDAHARVQLRFRDAHGRWSVWASAGAGGHEPDGPSAAQTIVGEPVWSGGSSAVAIRSDRALGDVRLACVDVSDGLGARRQAADEPLARAAALVLATPTLSAGPGQPPIIARRAWAQGMAEPRVTPLYGAVRLAFVHHTENPNGYSPGEVPAMLRAIFVFHRYVRGWNDIGYNFVVDLYGRIFEARAGGIDEPVVGAQAGGYNAVSTGVAVLGEFMSTPISPAAGSALEALLAWKLSLHGAPSLGRVTVRVNPAGAIYSRFPAGARVSLPRVAGHRDGDSTDCPGDALYGQLPALRQRIHSLAGHPARVTLALAGQAPLPAPAPVSPAAGAQAEGQSPPPAAAPGSLSLVVGGRVEFLAGGAVAGAPVLVQARSVSERGQLVGEQTIAQTISDADGGWSVSLVSSPGGPGTSLRALCPGASEGGVSPMGATVSEPLRVAGALSAGASACAQWRSVWASRGVSPFWGSVATSSVGALRACAHSWQAALKPSSIQASARSPA